MQYYPNELTPADGYAHRSISKQDQKIITALKEAGTAGLTRQEISVRTEISIRSVTARTNELLHDGVLVPKVRINISAPVIELRKTTAGRPAQVLVLANSVEVA